MWTDELAPQCAAHYNAAMSEAPQGIHRVEVSGLHGHQAFEVTLKPGLNIFHGKNGGGKTTFLHILANLVERDIGRFGFLVFERIKVETFSGASLELRQARPLTGPPTTTVLLDGTEAGTVAQGETTPASLSIALRDRLGGRSVYLPAFRSVLETVARHSPSYGAYPDDAFRREVAAVTEQLIGDARFATRTAGRAGEPRVRSRAEQTAQKTVLCRRWFGNFVPLVRFPSLSEMADELSGELQQAQLDLSVTDQEAINTVFVEVLETLLAPKGSGEVRNVNSTELLDQVRGYLDKLSPSHGETARAYEQLSARLSRSPVEVGSREGAVPGILEIYARVLQERANSQERAFAGLRRFEESVNRFLVSKPLTRDASERVSRARFPRYVISLPNGTRSGFNVLSSGERHVLTVLFSATHMSQADGIVLIDEPELSLHVEWQRHILTELMKQAGSRQVVACTHAPEVAAENPDRLEEFSSREWCPDGTVENASPDSEEDGE